jgi:hypothetical protein
MHHALSLPEIVDRIVDMNHRRANTLVSLTTVNHMFSEAALDHIWAKPPLIELVERMPEESYFLECHSEV